MVKSIFSFILLSVMMVFASLVYAQGQTTILPFPEEKNAKALMGTFDITTNYVFRGLSVSDNSPAAQGGLTYTFLTNGIYLNLWGSNVHFKTSQDQTATTEVDGTIGIANKIGEAFNYDVNFEHYSYPGVTGENYNELIVDLGYHFLTTLIGYSNNVYNTGKSGTYLNIGVQHTLPAQYIFNIHDINVSAGVGYYKLPTTVGLHSYVDYAAQISKTIGCYALSLEFTDTNHNAVDESRLSNVHVFATVLVNI